MRKLIVILLALMSVQAFAQVDRHELRSGNRKFNKENYKEAEIFYRKAALKDSLSVAAQYNLGNTLYREQDFAGAKNAFDSIRELASEPDYHFNAGDIAIAQEDYAGAVEAFKQALLRNPGDMDAKENYIYAKKMLENQQNQQQDQQDQQDDQNQDQDQQDNQNQDQNQDQQDNQNQDQDQQQNQSQDSDISPQQAQQMLRAIQAKEKDTQDKVNKEKAAILKTRQREKNW